MVDGGERDEKILAVPVSDPRFKEFKDLGDVNPHMLKEFAHFFLTYKQLQDKEVTLEAWQGRAEAEAAFERGVKMYADKQ